VVQESLLAFAANLPASAPMKWLKILYVQVLIGIILGVLLGLFYPETGTKMQPLAAIFIKAIKMLIAPIIFCTVVAGIASMGDLKRVGRVGWKALVYFEVLTTLALIIGLLVANIAQPGAGMPLEATAKETAKISEFADKAHDTSTITFVMNIVPKTFVGAFTDESVLPALFLAILVAVAMCQMQERGQIVLELLHAVGEVFFKLVAMITKVAPIAAFGAMAYTVGSEGPGTLVKLAKVLGCVYVTCGLFVFVVLGLICRFCGFSLWKVLVFIKDEIMLVLGTSSSETALPQLMKKLENAGCDKSVVGVVIPSGYSFNLDGTCIYLTLAALFVAQATNTPLTLGQQLMLLGVLLLTSKGAAGVTGAGFITLVATLEHHRHRHPRRRTGDAHRHRPIHVRSTRPDQSRRQHRRHARRGEVGEGIRCGKRRDASAVTHHPPSFHAPRHPTRFRSLRHRRRSDHRPDWRGLAHSRGHRA
jgi:aerobic C4-dicarboxylate transport protein